MNHHQRDQGDFCPHCGNIIVWPYNLQKLCQFCGKDVNADECQDND